MTDLTYSSKASLAAHDMTANLGGLDKGCLFLIPSSVQASEIVNVLREGYDVSLLTKLYKQVAAKLMR